MVGQALPLRLGMLPMRVKAPGKYRQVFVCAVPFDQQEPVQRRIGRCAFDAPHVLQSGQGQRLLPPMRLRNNGVARIHHPNRALLPSQLIGQE